MKMKKKDSNSVTKIIARNVFTYFNLIFLIIAVLLILAGSFRSLTFLPVVIANMLIGIVQQLRAKKVLDELTLISQAKYKVLRGGEELELPTDDLQQGDLLFLEGGQQIPADAEVVEGKIAANEALLTGESDEIEKLPGSELMSGSFVVSGNCRARLTKVGEESYIAQLTEKAKEVKDKQSEMIGDIERIIKAAGILIIPIGGLLMYQGMVTNGKSFSTAVVSMVGAIIGMIPEGLYLLVTVALALSAARLAKKQVLLHDMRSTETLARVDVLCVDKTGTITSNEMEVMEVFAPAGQSEADTEAAKEQLRAYVATVPDNNITSQAIQNYYPGGAPMEDADVTPFSSKTKYSEVRTADTTFRFGAPEFVLDSGTYSAQKEAIEQRAGKGERVLVFAADTGGGFQPRLFLSLINGLRPNVEETFRYFADQEVKVMVISGDNPLTVSKIAGQVHIPGAEHYVDAGTLRTEEQIAEAVDQYTVFGRVKPEQKKQIVEALKAKGRRVAMTGDGVNDILAMKEADCSIAMGAGSDAAMQAAQVVLLDSNFSHMKEIIGEGRRDINNITRSATLFLYKNIFSMLLALFSIFLTVSYPLQPSQVSLVSMFNIGVPAFLLALEPNERKQHGRFFKVVLLRSLPAALTSFVTIAALMVFGNVFKIPTTDIGIASTYLLSIVGFMILFKLCKPMNRYRQLVLILCIAGFVFCAYFFNSLFAIDYISYQCIMLAVLFGIAQESIMRFLVNLFEDKLQNLTVTDARQKLERTIEQWTSSSET